MNKWPTDKAWRRFAARIADGVTLHVYKGGKICGGTESFSFVDRCPLGTVVGARRYPGATTVSEEMGVPREWAFGFISGFDGRPSTRHHDPSFQLGRAYRKRFVEGA